MARPSWQQQRIDQMAYAMGVEPAVLGLPRPTPLELASERFCVCLEQFRRTWRLPVRSDRKIADRKIGATA